MARPSTSILSMSNRLIGKTSGLTHSTPSTHSVAARVTVIFGPSSTRLSAEASPEPTSPRHSASAGISSDVV